MRGGIGLKNFTSEGREKAIFDRLMSIIRHLLKDKLSYMPLAGVSEQYLKLHCFQSNEK